MATYTFPAETFTVEGDPEGVRESGRAYGRFAAVAGEAAATWVGSTPAAEWAARATCSAPGRPRSPYLVTDHRTERPDGDAIHRLAVRQPIDHPPYDHQLPQGALMTARPAGRHTTIRATPNDLIRTLVDVTADFSDRVIPAGTEGVVVEPYDTPMERYAVDLAIEDDTLVGGYDHENVILYPEQFIAVRSGANCLGWITPRLTVPWGR